MGHAILGRLAGYEDTNDADRLRVDPAMRHVVGGRAKDKLGASTSEMRRFDTELLPEEGNLQVLSRLPGRWVKHVTERNGLRELVLDLDSSGSPTHGRQGGSAYNGHFVYTCYHPLFCFNQLGDLLGAMLRRGNVHSASERQALLSEGRAWPCSPHCESFRSLAAALWFPADTGRVFSLAFCGGGN